MILRTTRSFLRTLEHAGKVLLIDKGSRYTLAEGAALSAPPQGDEVLDTSLDCYLFDIQNGEDKDAGIRLAEQMTREFIKEIQGILSRHDCTIEAIKTRPQGRHAQPSPNVQAAVSDLWKLRERRLVVFSSSPESVALAKERLIKVMGDYSCFFSMFATGLETLSIPLRIKIMAKEDFSAGDLYYRT